MPRIFRGKPFTLEQVPQMSATPGTHDLHALTIRIRYPSYRPLNLVVETGPTASRMKLVGGTVQRTPTLFTRVSSRPREITIDPGKGLFRPLVEDHAFFRIGQFSLLRHRRPIYQRYH
jgi:hypothetical protein